MNSEEDFARRQHLNHFHLFLLFFEYTPSPRSHCLAQPTCFRRWSSPLRNLVRWHCKHLGNDPENQVCAAQAKALAQYLHLPVEAAGAAGSRAPWKHGHAHERPLQHSNSSKSRRGALCQVG